MPRRLVFLLCLVPGLWPLSGVSAVHWLCGLSDDLTRIVCVADSDELVVTQAPGAAAAITTTVTVNGTRFPLDPGRSYTVDLWSPATEPAFAEQLARATICYRSPGCDLTFSAPIPLPASLRAARVR